jgi:type 1 glutamine amidotransferase
MEPLPTFSRPAALSVLTGLASLLLIAPASAQAPFKVFMIASKAQDHINCSNAARPVVQKLGEDNGFSVDFTTDTSLITEANLAKYDVFFQMHLAPFEMNAKHRVLFQKFVESGKGWLGIHAAGLTGNQFTSAGNWTFYNDMFGNIDYVTHPALQNGTLVFEDRTHPVTRNMPASFVIRDEWYEWSGNPRPRVRVLAKADESTYSPVKRQGDHPMIWTNENIPRMVYIGVGHDVSCWTHAEYVKLVKDALLWARPATTALDPLAFEKGRLAAPRDGRAGASVGTLTGWNALGRMGRMPRAWLYSFPP